MPFEWELKCSYVEAIELLSAAINRPFGAGISKLLVRSSDQYVDEHRSQGKIVQGYLRRSRFDFWTMEVGDSSLTASQRPHCIGEIVRNQDDSSIIGAVKFRIQSRLLIIQSLIFSLVFAASGPFLHTWLTSLIGIVVGVSLAVYYSWCSRTSARQWTQLMEQLELVFSGVLVR